MTAHRMDRAIETLARNQHGVFSTRQARDRGATDDMISRRRRNGRWLQLAPTVWALPGNPFTWERQMMAAHLSVAGSAVSGLAAAHLYGLDGCRPVRPEMTVRRGANHRSRLGTVHQSDRFVATTLGPFRIATVEQTLCDSAGRLGPRLDDVVVGAIEAGSVTAESVMARATGLFPAPPQGLARLMTLAEELRGWRSVPRSALELALFRVLDDPRIPYWESEASPSWWPGADERLDVVVPSWRLIVEADGRKWHTRRADFESDRRRDHIALTHGHRTVRFTYDQLLHEPGYAIDVLLAAGSGSSSAAA